MGIGAGLSPCPSPSHSNNGADEDDEGGEEHVEGRHRRGARHIVRAEEVSVRKANQQLGGGGDSGGGQDWRLQLPGLCRLKTRTKPATKAGKREVFGKVVMVKAKPARKVVKAFPAKALKDSV